MNVRSTIAVLLVMASTGGCGGLADPSENITDYASGTIPRGGAGLIHAFTASRGGEYTLTVTTMTPPTSAYFTMVRGQLSGTQCSTIQATYAVVGVAGMSGRIEQGNYCVQLQDTGFFVTSEDYTLKMWHP